MKPYTPRPKPIHVTRTHQTDRERCLEALELILAQPAAQAVLRGEVPAGTLEPRADGREAA